MDAYGHILWLDQDATQLFQYTPEEVEGEDIRLLIPAFLLPAHPDSLPKVLITCQYCSCFSFLLFLC